MLPTTGFFKNIDCPYYESSCERPYCHFRHRKKAQESCETSTTSAPPEIPTYNPTPKSQLANSKSHIPISYVPDLAVRSERNHLRSVSSYGYGASADKPTYNPTPLSILSTGKVSTSADNTTGKKINYSETLQSETPKYSPTYLPEISNDINFEDLETEFDMIDELISDTGGVEDTINGESESAEEELKPKVEKKHNGSVSSKSKSKSRSHKSSSNSSKSHSKHKSSKSKSSRDDKKKEDTKKHDSKKHSSSRHKENSSDKDKHKSRERDKEKREKERKKQKDKERKEKDAKIKPQVKLNEGHESNEGNDFAYEDSDLEEDTLEECYKIFTEYKPTEPDIFAGITDRTEPQTKDVGSCLFGKRRVAHENVNKTESKVLYKPKTVPTPAQAMVNRLKAVRLAHANNEQNNIINEMNRYSQKRPAETPVVNEIKKVPKITSVKPSTSTSIVDDIISGKSATSKPRRIAPVQNINSIQRAKARIEEFAKLRAVTAVANKTPQTTTKTKRVAHIPEAPTFDIPEVLEAERSKLPVNVRTRFMKMIVDECVKLYLSTEEAQHRALTEEFKCYERCAALVTYRNSAMLAISRLRKELQEREMSGLGPILPGEVPNSTKDTKSELRGRKFYDNIKRYILNDEELVLHGFPREGSVPGRAIVKAQRKIPKGYLSDEDRTCCRCAKLYKVDHDGFPLYPEECIYHPLKKRTFRGDSIYLCCKSNADIGCVTSTTHVSEAVIPNDAEIEGYQTTLPPEYDNDPRSYEIFALDCEMCYTTKGLELTRVTVVNSECKTVYESLVKPLNSIIDYNTRFSGITEEQMNRTATSILQVQANILHLCNSNTILIGHSLESDMKALKIIHNTIIDTSVLFPHKFGLPHKRALRDLAREYLKKIIQNDVSGHDSAEDALTCMELVQWKLKEELKVRGIKV